MRSLILIAAAFATLPCANAAGSEPVSALLYGPSEEIRNLLDELPKSIVYQDVTYRAAGSKRGRRLLVGVSGGIESTELIAVLYAARIDDWTLGFSKPWRLYVHGNGSYSRITVKDSNTCFPPTSWFLLKDKGQWVVFDGPGTPTYSPPQPCEFVPPQTTEYEGSTSNKSLERTHEK